MNFLSVKAAVMQLLTSEKDTDRVLTRVNPERHEDIELVLKSVKDKLKDAVAKDDPTLGGSTSIGGGGVGQLDPGGVAGMKNAFKSEDRKGAIKDKGFFSTEHLHEVLAKPHHAAAREYAHSLVDGSNAHEGNKAKARDMINRSKNQRHLAQGMANFMMAHPSEGMGMGGGKKT